MTKKISNEFMEKILTDSAWKSLSEDFQWTEQWLDNLTIITEQEN